MHFDEGQLRAYLDGQQPAGLSDHLETCPRCHARLEGLREQSQRVAGRLAVLPTLPPTGVVSPTAGRARLARRLTQKTMEDQTMFSKLFSPRSRPVWGGLALIAVLAVALAFPPVRAIANSFLGLFRVQQVSVVRIDPSSMQLQIGGSDQFEAMLSEDFSFSEGGESQPAADAAEAAALAGFTVRLPTVEYLGEPELIVQGGGSATYTIDQPRLQALMDAIGRSDISLPGSLDGAVVTLTIPAGVTAAYDDCVTKGFDPAQGKRYAPGEPENNAYDVCTTLIQMPSPTIDAPEGLDLRALGEAYLQILGMERAAAANFAANIDWATTLVIPIPSDQATYRDVSVDGVPATLIETSGEYGYSQFMLIWVKDGIVYALSGPGGASQALTLAESLR